MKQGAQKENRNAVKKVDWDRIDKLLEINCTGEEIATVLGIDYDTIANHCKKEHKCLFSEYIKRGNYEFKISLKRLQFRSAKGLIQNTDGGIKVITQPSVTMQIWLGKQYLEQKDRTDVTSDNEKLKGIQVSVLPTDELIKRSEAIKNIEENKQE